MARAVGLDAGVHEVKVVELDGSYRKPRLAKVSIDRVPGGASAELVAQGEARAALHALKDQHIKLDTVNLGYPCRDAVLRTLKIPFVGDDAIRKVIKFEAENSIHSHSVDDMVVDFHEIGAGVNRTLLNTIGDAIVRLNKERGYTFCVIEHDMDFIARLCDPVIVMAEGKVLAQGSADQIRANEAVIEAYLGTGLKNKVKEEAAHG